MKPVLYADDRVAIPLSKGKQLDINTVSVVGTDSPSPYACDFFKDAALKYIENNIDLSMVNDPLKVAPEECMKIDNHIRQKIASEKTSAWGGYDKLCNSHKRLYFTP